MRSLGIERLYSLGDYKNIKIIDTIDNLPYTLDSDQEVINTIRFLQMVGVDLAFLNYMDLNKEVKGMTDAERKIYLIEQEANTLEKIKTLLGKKD